MEVSQVSQECEGHERPVGYYCHLRVCTAAVVILGADKAWDFWLGNCSGSILGEFEGSRTDGQVEDWEKESHFLQCEKFVEGK